MQGDVKLATWLNPGVAQRLRLTAVLRRTRVSHLLTAILDEALPSDDELAGQIQGKASA